MGRTRTRAGRRVEETLRSSFLRHRPELVFQVGVDIVFHQNRRTMASWSRRGSQGTLRLHEVFAEAPDEVLEAVVRHFFTSTNRRETRRLRARILDFVGEKRALTLREDSFPPVRPPKGRFYDLEEVRHRVTRLYLPEQFREPSLPRMGWSFRATPSLMGKWIEGPPGTPNLIVINRLLDSKQVPRFYVEYIVYHELLHDLFPIRRCAGRWVHHPAEFRRRERAFPRYDEARRWEADRLPELIRSA